MPVLGGGGASGLPTGGATGQALRKHSSTSGDVEWFDLASLSNATPQPPGAAAVGAAATAARGDHAHASLGLLSFFWGNGSDGAAVLDGTNTYGGLFTKSGNTYTLRRNVYLTNLTVNNGVTLITANYVLNVSGTASVAGTIHNNGANGSGATGGVDRAYGTLGNSGNGGAGGTTTGSAPPGPSKGWSHTQYAGGGPGGTGASGAGGAGGPGDLPNYNLYVQWGEFFAAFRGLVFTPDADSSVARAILNGAGSGGGGGGDGTNAGGGGGSGGGVLIVNSRILTGAGSITANGGNGAAGTGGNAAGGGGGGGGMAFINTTDSSGWTGSVTANAGSGGAGSGTGGLGTAGSAGLTQLTVWT